MLDDAHGLGVIGDGTGSNSLFKKKPDIDIYLGTYQRQLALMVVLYVEKNLIRFYNKQM